MTDLPTAEQMKRRAEEMIFQQHIKNFEECQRYIKTNASKGKTSVWCEPIAQIHINQLIQKGYNVKINDPEKYVIVDWSK